MVNKTETFVACIGELAPRYVIGGDPFDVERLAWNVQRAEYGRAGEVTQSALAAFDVVDHAPFVSADDGCFGLPDRPGLGVRLNHNACAAHPRTGGRLKLFEAGW